MAKDSSELEASLSVGQTVIFHPEPGQGTGRRYKTIVRGWHKGYELALDRPRANDRLVALRDNQPCVIRFLYEGMACGFDTYVLNWDTGKGRPQFRITWPQEYKLVSLRKHERVKVELKGTVELSGGTVYPAEIQDLSVGGCGFWTKAPVVEESTVRLSLTLPDGSVIDRLEGVACSTRPLREGTLVGCQYAKGQDIFVSDIRFYVLAVLGRMREVDMPVKTLVVLEPAPEAPGSISPALVEQGFEVIPSTCLVDAFFRLRMAKPAAMVVHFDQKELPWHKICSIVKSTRGLETLPLFLYTGAQTGIDDEILNAGVEACFDTPHALAKSIANYL